MSGYIRDYLSFTRSEKRGILILLSIVMMLVMLPHIFTKDVIVPDPAADALYKVEAEEFLKGIRQGRGYSEGPDYSGDPRYSGDPDNSGDPRYSGDPSYSGAPDYSSARKNRPYISRFKPRIFDPNTATAGDYITMGFTEKQAAVIIRYRNKGGSFRVKEDFSRLYVVDSSTYRIFEPYIQIKNHKAANTDASGVGRPGEEVPGAARSGGYSGAEHQGTEHSGSERAGANKGAEGSVVNYGAGFRKSRALIELNSADSLELLKIYGVGPVFASRILKYRNKTGGFYSIQQLAEVYGIDSTRYAGIAPQVCVDTTLITKININTITLEALRRHPYIDYYTAKALIDKRIQLGSFKTMDEIRQVLKGKEGLFEMVKGYVEITSPRGTSPLGTSPRSSPQGEDEGRKKNE